MNQHTLACRHFGDMPERVGGGNECNWNCHGIDAAQVARVTRKQARGAANMRTQGGSNQSDDSVSDAKVGHALADCHDTPGGLRTEPRRAISSSADSLSSSSINDWISLWLRSRSRSIIRQRSRGCSFMMTLPMPHSELCLTDMCLTRPAGCAPRVISQSWGG